LPHDRRRRFGGPDLKGVTGKRPVAWLERVIVEPDKLAADKDPIRLGLMKQYGGEMPNLGISRKDAKKIIAYLQNVSRARLLRVPPRPPVRHRNPWRPW